MWLYDPSFFQLARTAMIQIIDMLDPADSSELHEHLAELDRRNQVELDRRKQAAVDRAAGGVRG